MYKTIFRQIASLQIILGFVIMVPAAVAIIYEEWYSMEGFLLSGSIISASGYIFYKLLKNEVEPEYRHSLVIAALGWLMIIIVGGVPFYVIAHITPIEEMQKFVPAGLEYTSSLLNFKNPLHCIFESTSAYTTTGFTMAYHEPSVGKSVLFYRSFANWVGGAGFIVMALAIFRHIPGQGAISLYNSEASGVKLRSNVIHTARGIWKAYAVVSVLIFVYIFIGTLFILPEYPISENLFDAINHMMSAIATGGFSTLDDSIASYKSYGMDMLMILPQFLGGLSLPFYYRFFIQRKFDESWKDIQTRGFFIATLIGCVILPILLIRSEQVLDPFREGIFQFVSAISTTGWQTSNIGAWDDISILFIVAGAMIVGGCAGGTVGGIKVIRALLLQKGLRWHISKIFLSKNTIKNVKFNNSILLPDQMNAELARAGIFVLIYLMLVFVSTCITVYYMGDNFTLADAIFESASAQATVGLSTGITDPSMSPVLEAVYIFQMWTGRIEILPVLVLLRVLIFGTAPRII
jgi:trk system potassium uptake protein